MIRNQWDQYGTMIPAIDIPISLPRKHHQGHLGRSSSKPMIGTWKDHHSLDTPVLFYHKPMALDTPVLFSSFFWVPIQ